MRLQLIRPPEPMMRREGCTLGFLYIDGKPFCFTCEDVLRVPFEKVKDKTAISAGTYNIIMTFSPHFQKVMPELEAVPNFTNIRIHPGNGPDQSSGCILVGDSISMSVEKPLQHSLDAFGRLMMSLDHAFTRKDSVSIEVRGILA
jgi:hypothetical protein